MLSLIWRFHLWHASHLGPRPALRQEVVQPFVYEVSPGSHREYPGMCVFIDYHLIRHSVGELTANIVL